MLIYKLFIQQNHNLTQNFSPVGTFSPPDHNFLLGFSFMGTKEKSCLYCTLEGAAESTQLWAITPFNSQALVHDYSKLLLSDQCTILWYKPALQV